MKVFVIVGYNGVFENTSARAVYSTREKAETYNPWFDDKHVIVELELDAEVKTEAQATA